MPQPNLSEPAPLPEPAKLPMPQPVSPPLAAGPVSPSPSADPGATPGTAEDGVREVPITRPIASVPDESDGREALINPGEALAGEGATRTPANPAPEPLRTPALGKVAVPQNAARSESADLAAADQLFRDQRFDESGRIYAALAARNLLPADRRPHWAYCRFKAVVRRINAGPRSAREWDAIEAEVRNIQRLTPGNWYGDYLISKIAEARRPRKRRTGTSDNVVVRGSSPEEPAPPLQAPDRAPPQRRQGVVGRSRGTSAASGAHASPPPATVDDPSLNLPRSLSLPDAHSSDAGSRADVTANAQVTSAANTSSAFTSWQVRESPSFRIFHSDPELADRAAEVAESVRTAQANRWGSTATRAPWSPRCDLYLYPTARSYAESTGQPEMSPGHSTMSSNGVRVLVRRMNLRADNPLLLTTTLPHEVTHVVLADLFVAKTIPRWADEGLAVLAEPVNELRLRQSDLKGPLDTGHVFEAGRLMAMDYPEPNDWRLFYAQSVSLTQFLVEQGPPERFIRFVRDCQRVGTETALRDVYQIEGLAALQERWLDYARKHAATDVASRPGSETATDNAGRH
jgi:hypothetical protein